ncbi:MAG: MMPL family transporter [Verrucomicrobiota bacterium]
MEPSLKALQLIALFGSFIGLSLFAYKRLSFDTDPLELLPHEMPEVQGLKLYQQHFNKQVDLIIAVKSKDDELVERATDTLAEALAAEKKLVEKVTWNPPGIDNALAYSEIIAYLWWNADPAAVKELAASLAPEETKLHFEEAIETMSSSFDAEEIVRASTDPLKLTKIISDVMDLDERGKTRVGYASDDGQLRLIFVDAPGDNYEYKESLKWLAKVQGVIDDMRAKGTGGLDKVEIEYTGNTPYIAEVSVQMQNEMLFSAVVTISIIIFLFWLFYRCTTPLLWLTFCLLYTFALTVTIGTLVYERLGAMSVGFAAILVGLCVDYGFIVFQEWSSNPESTPKKLRKKIFFSVAWASGTTATVFLGLNLSAIPGARQLGTMVAIGIIAGSIIMLFIFPWLITLTKGGRGRTTGFRKLPNLPALPKTAIGLAFAAIVLATVGRPGLSTDEKALDPKKNETRDTMTSIIEKMGQSEDRAVYVIFRGDDYAELLAQMENVNASMEGHATINADFPIPFLPTEEFQKANKKVLFETAAWFKTIDSYANEAGLTEDATALFLSVFKHWRKWGKTSEAVIYPRQNVSRDLLNNFLSLSREEDRKKDQHEPLAIGRFIFDKEEKEQLEPEVSKIANEHDGLIVSWSQLRPAIQKLIRSERRTVLIPLSGLVLVMLILAFRRSRDVVLSISTFVYSALLMLAIMSLGGMEWNIINLAAVPLLLGAGLDYSIHMLMAVRRLKDNVEEAKQTIGRALLLCGLSSTTGFATVAFSSNRGLSQLGTVCATGLALTMITAVFLLPGWADAWNKVKLRMKGESKNPQIS